MNECDCTHLLQGRAPSRILKKTITLLEHQITKHDTDRNVTILNQYVLLSRDGFYVKDLTSIMQLVDIIKKRINGEAVFEEPLNKLLEICWRAPVLTKTSEVITFGPDIKEYFAWLGYMIVWSTSINQKSKLIDAIHKLLTKTYKERNILSLAVRKEMLHSSNLPTILGELLVLLEDELYYKMLKIFEILSKESKSTCEALLNQDVVQTLILRLDPAWAHRCQSTKPDMPIRSINILHTDTIFNVLIMLLRNATSTNMRAPNKVTLWSLQCAFQTFSRKEKTKAERNNVLAVLILILDIYPHLLVGNISFAYDIARFAMYQDLSFRDSWIHDVKFTNSEIDHNFMALLLVCISYFPNCLSGPKVIEECRIVIGLLKLIANQQAIKWSHTQLTYLVGVALNVLHAITPFSVEEFIEDGGPLVILQFLDRCHDNQHLYYSDLIFRGIGLLLKLSHKFKTIQESLAFNDGVACILRLCEQIKEKHFLKDSDQKIIIVAIGLLESICRKSNIADIVPVIIHFLNHYLNPKPTELSISPILVIVCLRFVWNRIVPHVLDSQNFVSHGGIFLILDIVKKSCMPVRMVALGTLVDLCEITQCIPYLVTWKNDGTGIQSLLMDVFNEENDLLSLKIDKHGIITDVHYPVMGEAQFYETYCMCLQHSGNASMTDMFLSCRPKVYCLLQMLNDKQLDVVEIVNEFYKVYDEDLSIKQATGYVLAENYLALKLCEGWNEIRQHFIKLKIKPIPLDDSTLSDMSTITTKWGHDIQLMQQDVLRNYKLKQHQKEQSMYNMMKNSRLAEAWDALSEIKYIARCSERLFRITSNMNLQCQINYSLHVNSDHGQLHRTFPSNPSVTVIHNQNITIPSQMKEASKLPHRLISPATSREALLTEDDSSGEYLKDLMEADNDSSFGAYQW